MICMLAGGSIVCNQRILAQEQEISRENEGTEEMPVELSTDETGEKEYREGFSIREISDDLFDRMKGGNTYKEDCIVPREDLRYLMVLHKDKDGNTHQGEMVVHKLIAEDGKRQVIGWILMPQ